MKENTRRLGEEKTTKKHNLSRGGAHLEAFVLQHLFDGHLIVALHKTRLKDDAKGAITNDLAVRVVDLQRLL